MSATLLILVVALDAAVAPPQTTAVAVVERTDAPGVELRALRTRFLRQGESVALTVVVLSHDGRDCRAPAELLPAHFEGRACDPLLPGEEARLRWFEARPEARDYDNVRSCHSRPRDDCADPIRYRYEEIAAWRSQARVQANAAASRLGSHRYAVTLGPEPSPVDGSSATLPEIVVRRDDSYVGYLTELVGTPFAFWPTASEVDERRGADCVALVIYGQRRLGRLVPYVSPGGLKKLTARIAAGRLPRDRPPGSRSPRIPVRVGDIVHFGFQTAVVVEDRLPRGVLNEDDVIIHSYHGVAEEVPLGSVPYAHFPFEVRRWAADGATQGERD